MEVDKNYISSSSSTSDSHKEGGDDHHVQLPGFRFHPTDEELVGFYLTRKVERRPTTTTTSIELIKQADIYKYDPWDLPKSGNVGDKEWYFFCKRGRKYRNSIRPNRVTGSGFWKATGIDKPIYSSTGEGRRDCIGLKKSLVYYRGFAGKGTKTDWMMHEFRLPPDGNDRSTKHNVNTTKVVSIQEAEVWTLCRIIKRNVSYRKHLPDWRDSTAKSIIINPTSDSSSKTCSIDSSHHNTQNSYNINFDPPFVQAENKPFFDHANQNIANHRHYFSGQYSNSPTLLSSQAPSTDSSSIFNYIDNESIRHADWGDLRSIIECASSTGIITPHYY
ncbi:hypothetical protein OROGR_012512 [Orobanche gracilis]